MILGRNTQQWLGLISAFVALLTVVLVQVGLDPVAVATILGAIGTFLGVLVAFIANTSTTPISDPQLKVGTSVRVTDESGTMIGHVQVPTPPASPGA